MSNRSEASCQSVMTRNALVLKPDDTVGHGLELLLDHRLLALPVVGDNHRYLGMFVKSRLIASLLPKVVTLDEEVPDVARLLDIGFLTDSLDDLHARFDAIADEPVKKHLQTDTPVLRPDTSLMNALLFLYRTRNFLPVVDEKTGQLLGVVSTWDALAKVAQRPDRGGDSRRRTR